MIDKILSIANSIISNIDVWPLKNVVLVRTPEQNSQTKREPIDMCGLVGRYRLDIVESPDWHIIHPFFPPGAPASSLNYKLTSDLD